MNVDNSVHRCGDCGQEIPRDSTLGQCPRCLVRLGMIAGLELRDRSGVPPVSSHRRFGDYELIKLIGRGGMGAVYEARQVSLNRTVALKLILESHFSSPIALRRFEIEAEAAARLNHPNIVPIFDVGDEDDHPYLSMRYIDGECLARLKADGHFRHSQSAGTLGDAVRIQRRIVRLVATIARAVQYAHDHGVLHRDLKPGNILIDHSGEPFLTDFGLAKLTDSEANLSQTGAVLGTPSYMAPEQLADGACSFASDIYSLGAVLYELLTDRLPFVGSTPANLVRSIAESPPTRPQILNPYVDRDLETISLKCLEKDPRMRYISAGALADDLERWLRHEPVLARPIGSLAQACRWMRRNPIGTSLIFSLLLGLIVSISFLRLVNDQRRLDEAARAREDHLLEEIWRQLGVSGFWTDPNSKPEISSEILSFVAGGKLPAAAPSYARRYQIGMLLEEYPVDVIRSYAPLFGELERKLSESMGKPVLLNMRLYKENNSSNALADIVAGEIDILKIGGKSYRKAVRRDPGIKALVGQNPVKNVTIFTRRGTGIQSIDQLIGLRIARNAGDSTVSMYGVFHLVNRGIPRESFVVVGKNPRNENVSRLQDARSSEKKEKTTDYQPAIEAVLNGDAEAGIVAEGAFKRRLEKYRDLVQIEALPSSRVFWLAASNMPADEARHWEDAMVGLRGTTVFRGLSDKVSSYTSVTAEELEELARVEALVEDEANVKEEAASSLQPK